MRYHCGKALRPKEEWPIRPRTSPSFTKYYFSYDNLDYTAKLARGFARFLFLCNNLYVNELYFPEAIVLDREDVNGFDSRYSIYAKGFGKFFAKATSARKITSKLAPHLEPGNLVKIRVVGNGNFQVVDVLKSSKIDVRCSDLYLLNQMLPEHDFEFGVWQELMKSIKYPSDANALAGRQVSGIKEEGDNNPLNWRKVLSVLGWDPEHAACEICTEAKPVFFDIGTQSFFCENCFAKRGNPENFSFRRTSKDYLRIESS